MKNNQTELCPVCGMTVKSVQHRVQYHKMTFHFCSEQCHETFEKKPQLYSSRSQEKRSPVIKHRNLRLAEACPTEEVNVITACLKEMMGVRAVSFQGDRLQISYDLMQVTQARIEQTLDELGVRLNNNWWHKARRGWAHNIEENELDNLARGDSACCNRPPPGA